MVNKDSEEEKRGSVARQPWEIIREDTDTRWIFFRNLIRNPIRRMHKPRLGHIARMREKLPARDIKCQHTLSSGDIDKVRSDKQSSLRHGAILQMLSIYANIYRF